MTFYHVSHFIQLWLFPPGFNLLLIFIGMITLKRLPKFAISVLWFACASLWILSTPIVGQKLISVLQRQYAVLDNFPVNKSPLSGAIIVLGGGKNIALEYKNKYASSQSSLSRLRYGVHLHHQTNLPIIVSGGGSKNIPYSEALLMQNELQEYFNLPTKWKEEESLTTSDEAKIIIPWLQKNKILFAYIVTDAWHMPRAMYAFKHACINTNIKIIPAPTNIYDLDAELGVLKFFPSITGLYISDIALHEYIGLIWYYLHQSTN